MPTGKPTKMKPCAICGELFLPKSPSSRICGKDHYAKCPICGKEILWNTTRAIEPCSEECRRENTKRKNIEKYGVEHPMQCKEVQEHHRQAMMDKYGVASPLQSEEIKNRAIATNRERFGTDWAAGCEEHKARRQETMLDRYGATTTWGSEILREKVKNTMIERYGCENPSDSEEINRRREQTLLERYGTTNLMKNAEIAEKARQTRAKHIDEIIEKSKSTWMQTLGVDNPSKCPDVIDKITATFMEKYGVKRAAQVPEFKQKMVDTMIAKYGVLYYHMTEEYRNSEHFRISKVNQRFASMLEERGIEYTFEFRIGMKSYDIAIPHLKTLVEIDPTYTHNTIGNHWDKNGLPEDYHLNKTQLAADAGYRCIHVFDWDDPHKIVDMLSPKQRIYARQCKLFKLNKKTTDEFLNEFHLQGTCSGQLLCIGLVKDDVLYQVMTFGKSRYSKSHKIELLRLCTRSGYEVVGGASKMFKWATDYWELYDIISYCDLSKFSGDVYTTGLGMKFLRKTPPQEVWSRDGDKVTANLLRQRGYDQLFRTNYGKGSNNEWLMFENGWLPVYDCGQAVYEFR